MPPGEERKIIDSKVPAGMGYVSLLGGYTSPDSLEAIFFSIPKTNSLTPETRPSHKGSSFPSIIFSVETCQFQGG